VAVFTYATFGVFGYIWILVLGLWVRKVRADRFAAARNTNVPLWPGVLSISSAKASTPEGHRGLGRSSAAQV
jgi:hypothetical protein